MKIKHELPSVKDYLELRQLAGWSETDEKATTIGLNNSLFSVVIWEGDEVIGIGRLVGDGGLYFYIQDLIVSPNYQSKGVGKLIMEELMGYIKTNAASGSFVALLSAKGLEKYYESFGFVARNSDAPGMYLVIQ